MTDSGADRTEHTPRREWEVNVPQLARALLDKYRPTARCTVNISNWPDELQDWDLAIYDRTIEQVVADVDFDGGHPDREYLVMPPDYTQPLDREPFASIEDPETLPPAGELIFTIVKEIDWILIGPNAAVRSLREVESMLYELHEHHDYSAEAIRTRLVEEAQQRGDLPDTQE